MELTVEELEKRRFPIGKFKKPEQITVEQVRNWITAIERFPKEIKSLVENLTEKQKKLTYRPDGWNIKQIVHHCADSHLNSLMRFKLTLTENNPTIKPYFEDRWAELIDGTDDNLEGSLSLITGLHYRWVLLLKSISTEDLNRKFVHPEHGKTFILKENIGIYAWHCQHHLAHIKLALKK